MYAWWALRALPTCWCHGMKELLIKVDNTCLDSQDSVAVVSTTPSCCGVGFAFTAVQRSVSSSGRLEYVFLNVTNCFAGRLSVKQHANFTSPVDGPPHCSHTGFGGRSLVQHLKVCCKHGA
ncbi:hypothetical protein COO60DRAFT_1532778 [Scenedesmus sp. NREL 46B-D3]|nr:hypothetical protein COO60DRAFT_1532778 [Scenedesmus sp. NREL 46B-D3]